MDLLLPAADTDTSIAHHASERELHRNDKEKIPWQERKGQAYFRKLPSVAGEWQERMQKAGNRSFKHG